MDKPVVPTPWHIREITWWPTQGAEMVHVVIARHVRVRKADAESVSQTLEIEGPMPEDGARLESAWRSRAEVEPIFEDRPLCACCGQPTGPPRITLMLDGEPIFSADIHD